MIKGINHQIIEITHTDNMYYERALLVLRPQYADIERELLEQEAHKLLSEYDTISTAKPRSILRKRVTNAFLFSAIGSLVTIFIYSFF